MQHRHQQRHCKCHCSISSLIDYDTSTTRSCSALAPQGRAGSGENRLQAYHDAPPAAGPRVAQNAKNGRLGHTEESALMASQLSSKTITAEYGIT
jgi:hypothetical protein